MWVDWRAECWASWRVDQMVETLAAKLVDSTGHTKAEQMVVQMDWNWAFLTAETWVSR